MRFRLIDADGHERPLNDVAALASAIRSGLVTPDTLLWDQHRQRWDRAERHDVFRALETDPPSAALATPIADPPILAYIDDPEEEISTTADPAPPSEPAVPETMIPCGSCQRSIQAQAAFCSHCGAATEAPADWWLREGQTETGPYFQHDLQAMLDGQRIGPDALIKSREMIYWLPIGTLPGFHVPKPDADPSGSDRNIPPPAHAASLGWLPEPTRSGPHPPTPRGHPTHTLIGTLYIGWLYLAAVLWALGAGAVLYFGVIEGEDTSVMILAALVIAAVSFGFFRVAYGLRQFRRWARFVATALIWIGIVGGFLAVFNLPTDPAAAFGGVIGAVILIPFLLYFRRRKDDFVY